MKIFKVGDRVRVPFTGDQIHSVTWVSDKGTLRVRADDGTTRFFAVDSYRIIKFAKDET